MQPRDTRPLRTRAPHLRVLGGGHPGTMGLWDFPLTALFLPLASRLSSVMPPPYVGEATRT